jgi:hypothetical protein
MKRYYSVRFGWLFGYIGPRVKYAGRTHEGPAWVWFISQNVCVMCADWQIEDCTYTVT